MSSPPVGKWREGGGGDAREGEVRVAATERRACWPRLQIGLYPRNGGRGRELVDGR